MFKTLLKKALLLTPPSQLNRVDSFLSGDRLRRFLSRVQSNDLKVFYDIGAYKGQWSAQVSTWCPDAEFFLFEANPKHTKDLTRTGFNFVITLLSSRVESKNYFAIGGTGDSYLQEMTYYYKDVKPSPITSSTLDEVAKTKGFPPPDFVKIDTQGSELDVIAGGLNCLMSAQFVVLEVGL